VFKGSGFCMAKGFNCTASLGLSDCKQPTFCPGTNSPQPGTTHARSCTHISRPLEPHPIPPTPACNHVSTNPDGSQMHPFAKCSPCYYAPANQAPYYQYGCCYNKKVCVCVCVYMCVRACVCARARASVSVVRAGVKTDAVCACNQPRCDVRSTGEC
jgi:hypothetical protein